MVRFVKEILFEFFDLLKALRPKRESIERIASNNLEIQVWQWLDLLHVFLINDQGEPEPQLGDFDRARVNVHAVEAVLNRVALEEIRRAFVWIVKIRCKCGTGTDNLGHHPDGKRA